MQPKHHVHLDAPVKSLARHHCGKIRLVTVDGTADMFDHVILAVHANQALRTLGESATPAEKETLKHFRTSRNVCALHSDLAVGVM